MVCRKFLILGVLGLMSLLTGCSPGSRDKPVKVVVPFAPGGGSDTLARVLVREIEAKSEAGASWVIINVPGAGGTIGSRRVKQARPDGNTLLFLHDGILSAKYAQQVLYGPEAFAPVAATGSVGMVICVAESDETNSLTELLDNASKTPDSITFAANIGAPSYFMAKKLEHAHGTAQFRYVQSGGGAKRFSDLSGGHVTASAFSISEYLNFREGGIRALAILDEERHASLPATPTAREEGFEIVYKNLQGWWAPLGTSPEILKNRRELLSAAFASETMQMFLEQQCISRDFLGPEEMEAAIQDKVSAFEALDLGFERKAMPPIELALGLILVVGILLCLSKKSRLPVSGSEGKRLPLRPVALQSLLLAAFLIILSLPGSAFLLSGILFVFLATFLSVGAERLSLSGVVALLAPAVLYVFLSTLLGIELP